MSSSKKTMVIQFLVLLLLVACKPAAANCLNECEAAWKTCRAQKPVFDRSTPDNEEPKGIKERRMAACESDRKRCTGMCSGAQTVKMQTAIPPTACLRTSPPQRVTGLDSLCASGYPELWILVENSHQPRCPTATRFTYTEPGDPARTHQTGGDRKRGPYVAPATIQTCLIAAKDILPTAQPVPSSTAAVQPPPPSLPGHDLGAPFNQYETSGSKRAECSDDLPGSLFTTGRVKYLCQHTELAHLQMPGNDGMRKFIGVACGRGSNDMLARHR